MTEPGCPSDTVLTSLLEGDLPEEERASVDAHASGCADCRSLLAHLARAWFPGIAPGRSDSQVGEPPAAGTGGVSAKVGRFVIRSALGAGAMGVVYEAYDPKLDRAVALKVLRPRPEAGDPPSEGQARLLREARAIARISHPNVLAVYDVGEHNGRVFLAMELVEGGTLADWLRERSRTWTEIVRAFVAVGEGLAAVHAAGLVHDDFKPENVLIGPGGRVRVSDFGFARPPPSREEGVGPAPEAGEPGTRAGTPRYMSPEKIDGRDADQRSDQFAYCVALYEALFGVPPFAGEDLSELRASQARAPVPPRGRVPRRVERVVLRGLALRPEQRHRNLGALLTALERALPERRRVLWATGIGAALLAAVVTWGLVRPGTPCPGGGGTIARIWNPSSKARVRQTLRATATPHAAQTWVRVERALDSYGRRWSAAHRRACAATWIRGEQSQALLDLRMRCLERRRREMAALIEELLAVDAAAVAGAVRASRSLGGLAACADLRHLTARSPEPPDAKVRRVIRSLGDQLDRVQALTALGRLRLARPLAESAAARSVGLGFPPVRARALGHLAQLQHAMGQKAEARRTALDAAAAALAARDDPLAARIGAFLAGQPETKGWAEITRALLTRLGGAPEIAAQLLNNLAGRYYAEGDHRRSLTYQRRAVTLAARELGSDHPALATYLANLGISLTAIGRAPKALPVLERALAIVTRSLGPDHPLAAEAHNNLADCYGELGRYREMLEHGRQAARLGAAASGSSHPSVANGLLSQGEALRSLGRPQEALPLLRRAVALRRAAVGGRHPRVGAALGYLGLCLRSLGRRKEAVLTHRQALRLQEKAHGRSHPVLVEPLRDLGESLLEAKAPVAAMRVLERARLLADPDPGSRAQTLFALARALSAAHGFGDRARTLVRQAEALFASVPHHVGKLASVRRWLSRKNPGQGR